MNWIIFLSKLLNENLGVVTFVVGILAIYIYIKQKADKKRDAAKLILQEIRYAEQQVRNYKAFGGYELAGKLLPTNSWNDNIHMFVKELKETEIDLINSFYARASYIDIMIRKISDFKTQPKVPMSLINNPVSQPTQINTAQGNNPQPTISVIAFDPMQETQGILADVAKKIEFIYNTPTLEKLRKISERKWYQPF